MRFLPLALLVLSYRQALCGHSWYASTVAR